MKLKTPPKGIGLYIHHNKTGERYQSRLYSPHTGQISKTKIWKTTDLKEAMRLHLEFRKRYESNNYELQTISTKRITYPKTLIKCASLYERYLRDDPELVPHHKRKHRQRQYISDTLRYIREFLQLLKKHKINPSTTTIHSINDEMVGLLFADLETRYKSGVIGDWAFNKSITACKQWIEVLISEFDYQLKNPFKNISTKRITTDPDYLEMHELDQLLQVITPGDHAWGIKGKAKKRVNYYRPWMRSYITLSAYVGARANEMAQLRWIDVQDDFIAITNSKVSAKQNQDVKSYVYIHPHLRELLNHLRKQSSSELDYVLVPDQENRRHLQLFVSKAFIHFYRQTKIKKKVSFANLRHTYINAVVAAIGEEGLSIHHRKETAVQYYLSKQKKLELQAGKPLFDLSVDYTL